MRGSILNYCLKVFIGFFLLTACSDNLSSVEQDPPKLPPSSSMEMDFSEFNEQNVSQKTNTVNSLENFGRAAITATVMKVMVDINLAIPRALLAAAENAEAEFNREGEWEWQFSKTEGEHS